MSRKHAELSSCGEIAKKQMKTAGCLLVQISLKEAKAAKNPERTPPLLIASHSIS
jgi:hypothetical protein